ncbi:hypothetical protein [Blastococcus litoris]|uniref:hypothetical protein n=1 Tax=Blastococcus litoris TaxID=2171622 RepID=UPI0013DEA7E9|nr:hypothetical protein [Blastococcus litoris]
MTTAGTRPHGPAEPVDSGSGSDEYSPAFAAWALLLTVGLLVVLVVAVWGLRGL